MMPPERRRKKRSKAAMARGGEDDRLSTLPDDVLVLIVSRLPSDDAVRTSVLAPRWRYIWRSATALRVVGRWRTWEAWTAWKLTNFMNHLLLLRSGGAAAAPPPLDVCEILCGELKDDYDEENEELSGQYRNKLHDELSRAAGLWIRHAVTVCHARVLRVCLRGSCRRLCLDRVRFDGQLLAKVELKDATFYSSSIDFSRCPAMEDLTMTSCKIHGDEITSPSLTRLSIVDCYFDGRVRTRISTPRLVRLQLSLCNGMAPLLEKMPMLEAANVRLEGLCEDTCDHNRCRHGGYSWDRDDDDDDDRDGCYCMDEDRTGVYLENVSSCDSCFGNSDDDDGSSILLQGLSSAMDLELTSDPLVFIFRKDCMSRATFPRLKTLLLNEWCMAGDLGALVYFLQYSPNLEKLTLQLGHCETRNPAVKTDNPKEQLFLVPKQLKRVYIKCPKENELVKKLIMILTTNGVRRKRIRIEQDFSPPELSGYETEDSDCDEW
ncbi:unnamed protein product [Urochloa decumbens]|uniref:F-box domain-containing protein n=1 Tax=Urochloa decumbens TaxID=240449 RepID=A0ABC9B524_9POAL